MNAFYQWLFKRHQIILLITILLLGAGFWALQSLHREAFPKVEFGVVTITTEYPGASSEEVELLVSKTIESALSDIEGIEEMDSVSTDGRSYISLRLEPKKNSEDVIDDIEKKIEQITDLPDDSKSPNISSIESTRFPVLTISLSGGETYALLRQNALMIKSKLEDIDGISAVTTTGVRDPVIQVLANPATLNHYYVSLEHIVTAIRSKNLNIPGGKLVTDQKTVRLRTLNSLHSTQDIENVVIRANDVARSIQVKEIASVIQTFEEPSIIYRTDGIETINVTIVKHENADILSLMKKIREIVDSEKRQLQLKGISTQYLNDISQYIARRLDVLTNNAILGIIILLASLLLLLHKRVSFYVALGIPFSILVAFIVMYWIGISLNLISLLAFILIIGMVVDNAIVIGENIIFYVEEGEEIDSAVSKGSAEMIPPILGATLTTFAAFSAFLFMGGTMGKFVWNIPIIVIITLLASLIYAIFILPPLMQQSLTTLKNKHIKIEKKPWFETLSQKYGKLLSYCIEKRYVLIFCFVLLFLFSLGLSRNMNFVLFPNEDADRFIIQFEGPVSMSLEQNEIAIQTIEKEIAELSDTELDFFVTSVGYHESSRMNMKRGGHFSQITVYLKPEQDRKRMAREIVEELRQKFSLIQQPFMIRFTIRQGGPPVGKAVKLYITGHDYAILNKAATTIQDYLNSITGIKDVDSNFKIGKTELHIETNDKYAAIHRVQPHKIAETIRTAFTGSIATTIRAGIDTNVTVLFDKQYRQDPFYLKTLLIPNIRGSLIQLKYLAKLTEKPGYADLYHFNGKRAIIVSSDLDRSVTNSAEVNHNIAPFLNTLEDKFPGVHIFQRGENKETLESIKNLGKAFLIALIFIYIILVSLFNRFFDPFLMMLTIPFGLIGIIVAFFIHMQPISFMMLMGSIGMAGVVVNNAIILIHVIRQKLNTGLTVLDAVMEGSKQRFRAVLITSVTTLLALFPTAYGFGGNDPFVEPMCLALAWGVFFATVLTLCLLPCILMIIHDITTKLSSWNSPKI